MIPASPEPQALEDRDPSTLSLEEARALLSRYRGKETSKQEHGGPGTKLEIKTEFKLPKRNLNTDDDDDECQIASVKKLKPTNSDEVDVLDLT